MRAAKTNPNSKKARQGEKPMNSNLREIGRQLRIANIIKIQELHDSNLLMAISNFPEIGRFLAELQEQN
jgi:hypothetical protein